MNTQTQDCTKRLYLCLGVECHLSLRIYHFILRPQKCGSHRVFSSVQYFWVKTVFVMSAFLKVENLHFRYSETYIFVWYTYTILHMVKIFILFLFWFALQEANTTQGVNGKIGVMRAVLIFSFSLFWVFPMYDQTNPVYVSMIQF